MKRFWCGLVLITPMVVGPTYANALDLSIYDVQYTTDAGGGSPYNEQTHNVLGGIVTHVKPWGSKPRVYIQDPAYATWAGIVVKDWTGGDLAQNVSVGDRIDLSNVFIEEASGTTTLQYGGFLAPDAGFTPVGPAAVPDPLALTAADLAAPVYDPVGETWFVEDHDSEPYEGMLVTLVDVDVGTLGLGKAQDNYELLQGDDVAWAADFMNWDAQGLYHPYIYAGARLERISGIVEQYVGTDDAGTQWDYYQLFTRTTADIVPEVLTVSLDIKPGGCPNPLNLSSRGVLPVGLLGTEDFNVATINTSTVVLSRGDGVGDGVTPHEGPPGPHSVFQDVGTPFDGDGCGCHEYQGDGIDDLSMKFRTDAVVAALELDDLPAGALVELVVSGSLYDGTAFVASDCIRLVPPGTAGALLAVESSVAGAWIGVDPLDETLDGGGFADFVRSMPLTTVVTLTAEEWVEGRPLRGWQIGGLLHHMGQTSVEFVVARDMTVRAVYGPTPSGGSPKPDPTAPEPFIQEETAEAGTIHRR